MKPLLVIAAIVGIAVANTTPPAGSPPTVSDQRAWTAVSCDEQDQAFNVEPDTPEAWREAQDWCTRSGAAIDSLPWPSGIRPTTLSDPGRVTP